MSEDGESKIDVEFEPYTTFTEKTTNIQWLLAQYRNEINGLLCPVSAGWPDLLEGVLKANNKVVGYDVNKRQIEWYKNTISSNLDTECILSDISTPTPELIVELNTCNFLFVSNIPDWLAGITGRAMKSTNEIHRERLNNFVNTTTEYLSLATSSSRRFILISSIRNKFLHSLANQISQRMNNSYELIIRFPELPKTYKNGNAYPINNYLIFESTKIV